VKIAICAGATQRAHAERLAATLAGDGRALTLCLPASSTSGAPRLETARAGALRIVTFVRTDQAWEHWQKSASVDVAHLWSAFLGAERPDIVHVVGWRGLSRELVHLCAEAGVHAVAEIVDLAATCLIGTRRRGGHACDSELAPHPCLACADEHGLETPWVPLEARFMAQAEFRRDFARELTEADRVLSASTAATQRVCRWLGIDAARLDVETLDSEAHAERERLSELYARVLAQPKLPGQAREDWFAARMRGFAQEQWDRGFEQHRMGGV
jgi:hypothetical protein